MNKKQSINLPFIICHRGASAYAAENTLVAFDCAHKMGGRWVEFDVRLCGSGEVVVFHNASLKAPMKFKGCIKRLNYNQLSTVNVSDSFTKHHGEQNIPLLSELLVYVSRRSLGINIELKTDFFKVKQLATAVVNDVTNYWPNQSQPPLFSSQSARALRLLREKDEDILLGMLMDFWSRRKIRIAQRLNCFSIHIRAKIINKKRVDYLHSLGFKVLVYTVNTKQQAEQFRAWGVDAIFTDYPDLLLKD